jgi:hypothetical protein
MLADLYGSDVVRKHRCRVGLDGALATHAPSGLRRQLSKVGRAHHWTLSRSVLTVRIEVATATVQQGMESY